MNLVFNLNRRASAADITRWVDVDGLRRNCHGRHGNTGCFYHNGNYYQDNATLTVNFSPVICLNQAIQGTAAESDARAHEEMHYRDFLRISVDFERQLRQAVRRSDTQIDVRYEWFLYDLCLASSQVHRQIGAQVEICLSPSGSRPR